MEYVVDCCCLSALLVSKKYHPPPLALTLDKTEEEGPRGSPQSLDQLYLELRAGNHLRRLRERCS